MEHAVAFLRIDDIACGQSHTLLMGEKLLLQCGFFTMITAPK